MEAHARSAVSTNTKLAWGLQLALIVHQTLPLQLVARPVFAKLAGREHTVSALPVCLGNSRQTMGLWRVHIAQTGNFQSLSVQPQTHAVIVEQACFRKTTEACV